MASFSGVGADAGEFCGYCLSCAYKENCDAVKCHKIKFTPFGVDFSFFLGIGIFDSWYHKPMSLSETQLNHAVAAEGEIVDVKTLASGDRLIVDVFKLAYDDGNIENCRNLKDCGFYRRVFREPRRCHIVAGRLGSNIR